MGSNRTLAIANVLASIMLLDAQRAAAPGPPLDMMRMPEPATGPRDVVPTPRQVGRRFLTCGTCGSGGGTLVRDGNDYRHKKC